MNGLKASGKQFESSQNNRHQVTDTYSIPNEFVGLIVGKGREQILRIQQNSGCKLELASDNPNLKIKPCTLVGSKESIEKAKSMMDSIIKRARDSQFRPSLVNNDVHSIEMMIPGSYVGLLIGKNGENIKNLQEKNDVRMILVQDDQKQSIYPKCLRISGSQHNVESAKQLVLDLISKNMEKYSNVPKSETKITVPKQAVSAIIGKSGVMIKSIQMESGCSVHFEQEDDYHNTKQCSIVGRPDQIHKAIALIEEIIHTVMSQEREDSLKQSVPQSSCIRVQFTIPSNKCGLVIGKGGETIRGICQDSGAHVKIAQATQPNVNRLITICGYPYQIEHAKMLIYDCIGLGNGQGKQWSQVPSYSPVTSGQLLPLYQQEFNPYISQPGVENSFSPFSIHPNVLVSSEPVKPSEDSFEPKMYSQWAVVQQPFSSAPMEMLQVQVGMDGENTIVPCFPMGIRKFDDSFPAENACYMQPTQMPVEMGDSSSPALTPVQLPNSLNPETGSQSPSASSSCSAITPPGFSSFMPFIPAPQYISTFPGVYSHPAQFMYPSGQYIGYNYGEQQQFTLPAPQ